MLNGHWHHRLFTYVFAIFFLGVGKYYSWDIFRGAEKKLLVLPPSSHFNTYSDINE